MLSEVNYVHPFREDNGRTQLQYRKQPAAHAGHDLDLTRIGCAAWLDVSRRSNAGDHAVITRCIRYALRKPIRHPRHTEWHKTPIGIALRNPLGHDSGVRTVCETQAFIRQAANLFTEDELQAVVNLLAFHPESGNLIPGTGGVRKVRVPAMGQGKRGGARVVYYWVSDDAPVYALLAYAKGHKIDMTSDEKRAVASLAAEIKSQFRRP